MGRLFWLGIALGVINILTGIGMMLFALMEGWIPLAVGVAMLLMFTHDIRRDDY